ncbi:unnamed protein product [Arctia plantaginis]|uniref:Uncharacterized protein n=1 Tax=Arctia plantaginis TaxID=874455 RepID=A0A8S0YNG8_ARCPL|nr:unnamed protein product [Arctia plantaginis]CAB3261591.1 unnamed protein product [Arctia plantaginis]
MQRGRASVNGVVSQPHLEFSSWSYRHCHRGGVGGRRADRAVGRPVFGAARSAAWQQVSGAISKHTAYSNFTIPATRAACELQANGIGFLAAKIPLRTFTLRPTEINRSFNANSTTLSPH